MIHAVVVEGALYNIPLPQLNPAERQRLAALVCSFRIVLHVLFTFIQTLHRAVSSTDTLFHVVLYRWFVQNNLTEVLLGVQSPYLENFLKTEMANSDLFKDLLWKYYVRNNKFAPACLILSQLADARGDISLEKRIEYLSLAIGMAKSCVGPGQPAGIDELLYELQDKLEVYPVMFTTLYTDVLGCTYSTPDPCRYDCDGACRSKCQRSE